MQPARESNRAAVRSTATKAPVGLWLARGSQRLGMSNVVAVSCNPYEESKEHGRPQAAKKSPVGSFLVFGSHPVGMSTVVAAAAFARGIFNLTRTGTTTRDRAAVRLHLEYHMPFYG